MWTPADSTGCGRGFIFVGISLPFIVVLSKAKNRLTFGDSGRLAYIAFVKGTGPAQHGLRNLSDDPLVYEFQRPSQGRILRTTIPRTGTKESAPNSVGAPNYTVWPQAHTNISSFCLHREPSLWECFCCCSLLVIGAPSVIESPDFGQSGYRLL